MRELLCILCAFAAVSACADDHPSTPEDARPSETTIDATPRVDRGQRELGMDAGCDAERCQLDTDCSDGASPLCDVVLGYCVGCRADNDCSAPYAPRCDPTTRRCVECFDHDQCTHAATGSRCVGGVCSCASSADCTSDEVWGRRCVELSLLGYAFSMCGCDSGADCADSRYGAHCYAGLSQCACADGSECSAPLGACARPSSITDYAFCQAACARDADCAGRAALTHCDTSSGACVECLEDADCAASPFGKVCATDQGVLTGSCVCRTVADCPNGTRCALDAFGLTSCQ